MGSAPRMTDDEVVHHMRSGTDLNRVRQAFSSAWGGIDQAGKQRTPLPIIELRRMEFEAVGKIVEAVRSGLGLFPWLAGPIAGMKPALWRWNRIGDTTDRWSYGADKPEPHPQFKEEPLFTAEAAIAAAGPVLVEQCAAFLEERGAGSEDVRVKESFEAAARELRAKFLQGREPLNDANLNA